MSSCPYIDGVILDKRLPRWNLFYLKDLKTLLEKYEFSHVFDLQNSNRTKFYKKYLLKKPIWSSSETSLEEGEKFYKINKHSLYSSHMIDLSDEPIEKNIQTCKDYLQRMSKIGMTLEIELGVTGGEEDGVDNTDIDSSKLYTQPEEVAYAYNELIKISDRFTVAAAFGNVHGVYKPGNVKLTPIILRNSQDYVKKIYNTEEKPIDFVFHGGSGSSKEEIKEAISYGAIKMNIDTDLQWGFTTGVRDYFSEKKEYLKSQIGNPEGDEKPNKKYYDPRVWLREGELTFKKRLTTSFHDLNNINRNI